MKKPSRIENLDQTIMENESESSVSEASPGPSNYNFPFTPAPTFTQPTSASSPFTPPPSVTSTFGEKPVRRNFAEATKKLEASKPVQPKMDLFLDETGAEGAAEDQEREAEEGKDDEDDSSVANSERPFSPSSVGSQQDSSPSRSSSRASMSPRVSALELMQHPILKRMTSGAEETPFARRNESFVLLNRTSSFSRIVYEMNDGGVSAPSSSAKATQGHSSEPVFATKGATPSRPTETPIRKVDPSTPFTQGSVTKTPGPVGSDTPAALTEGDSSAAAASPAKHPEKDRKADPFSDLVFPTSPSPFFAATSILTPTSSLLDSMMPDSNFTVKLGILLSRSSGRDKFAALLQYGALSWGYQPFVPAPQGPGAAWRKLEDSMSDGRKILRLFKWIKEWERVQRSFQPSDLDFPLASSTRTLVSHCLAFCMHTCSFLYYLTDNVLWTSQVGLINPKGTLEEGELRRLLKTGHRDFQTLRSLSERHHAEQGLRQAAFQKENYLKDWKNYFSLGRLLFAIVYCTMQLDSIRTEDLALIEGNHAVEKKQQRVPTSASAASMHAKVLKRRIVLDDLRIENTREILAALFNLIVLLNRLDFGGPFRKVPTWIVGLFGMAASHLGLLKNWPVKQKG